MADQQLMNYIRSNIKKSGPDVVRNSLISAGWDKSQVDQALQDFQAGTPPGRPAKPAAKSGGFDTKILAVLAVIAVLAVAAVYFMFLLPPSNTPVTPTDGNQGQAPVGPISVGVSPATTTAGVGDSVTVDITASGAETLFGFQFNIEYDPSILSFESISEGTFLNNNGADSTFCVTPKTDTAGLVKNYACTRIQKGEVTGTGTLARATFTALSAGTSTITLKNVKFANSKAEEISSSVSSGQVAVQ